MTPGRFIVGDRHNVKMPVDARAGPGPMLGGVVGEGRWLDAGTSQLPTVVLGSVAAERLGINSLAGAPMVTVAGEQFAVIGILEPLAPHADLDRR